MNLNRIIQSLLLMLALVGVFAAMARNAYGFDFIGVACLGLAILYLLQVTWKVISEYGSLSREAVPEIFELLLLAVLTTFFSLRAFYIYLDFSEVIFYTVCVLQIIVYMIIGYRTYAAVRKESKELATLVVFFFSSLTFFLFFILTRVNTSVSMIFAGLALLAAAPVIFSAAKRQHFEVKSKAVSFLQFVIASRNKAGLLFLFFISSTLFTGLTYFRVIPSIENTDRPKDYIDLISNAEAGKEKPINGHYQHEQYKQALDKFLSRHAKK